MYVSGYACLCRCTCVCMQMKTRQQCKWSFSGYHPTGFWEPGPSLTWVSPLSCYWISSICYHTWSFSHGSDNWTCVVILGKQSFAHSFPQCSFKVLHFEFLLFYYYFLKKFPKTITMFKIWYLGWPELMVSQTWFQTKLFFMIFEERSGVLYQQMGKIDSTGEVSESLVTNNQEGQVLSNKKGSEKHMKQQHPVEDKIINSQCGNQGTGKDWLLCNPVSQPLADSKMQISLFIISLFKILSKVCKSQSFGVLFSM